MIHECKSSMYIGKHITLCDISNIATNLKQKKGTSTNDLQAIISQLQKDPSITVEVFTDTDQNLMGIFYQDKTMKHVYSVFPEMLFVDATHKLNSLRMPLYVFLVCDGNGQSEIVASCLVVSEQRPVISQMITTFQIHNPTWTETNVIMTDKDMTERDVLQEAFPNATLQLCLFHVLRCFRREVTTEAMAIRSAERTLVLDILQKLAYSPSEEIYELTRKQLHDTNLVRVSEYFETNWHPIRHQWVLCFVNTFTFSIRTNNRLECINQKIKSVCSAFSDLNQFFCEFQTVISCQRDHVAMTCASKISVKAFGSSVEARYRQILTPFAAKYVTEQLQKVDKVNFTDEGVVANFTTSSNNCSCYFNKTTKLPCCHIFAFRSRNELPLFDKDLAHIRWHMSQYISTYKSLRECESAESASLFIKTTEVSKAKPKTQNEKFKAAQAVCSRLAVLVSEACGKNYDKKMAELERLQKLWEIGNPTSSNSTLQLTSTGNYYYTLCSL